MEAALYFPGWTDGKPGWMLTTDAAGGFRQLFHFPQFRLAVSKSDKLVGPVVEVCPPPAGWRLATAAELVAAGFELDGGVSSWPEQRYYCDQAGWSEWGVWEGVERYYFVTADWAAVDPRDGGVVFANLGEGDLAHYRTAAEFRLILPKRDFAGVVCVRACD